MLTIVIAYVATGLIFLAIDAIWLTVMADVLYRPLLGDRLADPFHLTPAIIFYLIYIAGIVALVVQPAMAAQSLGRAVVYGAILGCVAYATYDLTNHATLKDWPLAVTVADIIWGTVLTATASAGGFLVASRFGD